MAVSIYSFCGHLQKKITCVSTFLIFRGSNIGIFTWFSEKTRNGFIVCNNIFFNLYKSINISRLLAYYLSSGALWLSRFELKSIEKGWFLEPQRLTPEETVRGATTPTSPKKCCYTYLRRNPGIYLSFVAEKQPKPIASTNLIRKVQTQSSLS